MSLVETPPSKQGRVEKAVCQFHCHWDFFLGLSQIWIGTFPPIIPKSNRHGAQHGFNNMSDGAGVQSPAWGSSHQGVQTKPFRCQTQDRWRSPLETFIFLGHPTSLHTRIEMLLATIDLPRTKTSVLCRTGRGVKEVPQSSRSSARSSGPRYYYGCAHR